MRYKSGFLAMLEPIRNSPRFRWHSDVHLVWGDERLHFWRLGFYPKFDSQKTAEALMVFLEKMGVQSYAARETLGTLDIILRAWLPQRLSPEKFQKALTKHMNDVDLSMADRFDVSSVSYQWNWSAGTPPHPRSLELLEQAEQEGLGPLDQSVTATDFVVVLEREGLLSRTAPEHGIAFVMSVDGDVSKLSHGRRRALSDLLTGAVTNSPKVAEQTLYEGSGFASYLLIGKVDKGELDAVGQLSSEILKRASESGFALNTSTMLTHPQEVMIYREELPPRRAATSKSQSAATSALLRGRDAVTEITEAVLVQEANGGQAVKADLADFDRAASFLRSVVSFLNGQGGVVVLGATPLDGQDVECDEKYVIGDYCCVGVDQDHRGRGWDDYRGRLARLLARHISPSPTEWISIDREVIGDRMMAVVQVEEPPDLWFYLVGDGPMSAERFFVRRGETTIELRQSDADAYQRIDAATKHLGGREWAVIRALQRQPRLDRYQLASVADMSASDTDRALAGLLDGQHVVEVVGDDQIPRYAIGSGESQPESPAVTDQSSAA